MRFLGDFLVMQVSIVVSDRIIREAQDRNTAIDEFVEMLIDKGLETLSQRPVFNSAIERIRALHATEMK